MRQIDDFFSSAVGGTLYHYTGIEGLLEIVETRKISASHAYYLNDSKEILHACEVLAAVLSEDLVNVQNEEREFITQLKQWLETFRINAFHIFLFSLSEKRSLLSQWRSYTPHGKGVSADFSPLTLNRILQSSSGFRIAKCLYKPEEHKELMKSFSIKY